MKCPSCIENNAIVDRELGALPCDKCQEEASKIPKPSSARTYDFASPSTKIQRKEYGAEMVQPYVSGVLSREFVELYGTDKLANVTKKDIKNAKYVYQGMTRHHKIMENGKAKFANKEEVKDDYKVEEMPDTPE